MADVVEMLALSPTMDEGTIAEWTKATGDFIEEGEVIADVETDKATMEMESFYEGTLLAILVDAGDSVAVGQPIAIIGDEGEDISSILDQLQGQPHDAPEAQPSPAAASHAGEALATSPSDATPPKERAPQHGDRIFASPLARRIASDRGLSLSNIRGTGPRGRIIKADVEAAQSAPLPARAPAPSTLDAHREPLSQMRKTIARRLRESWQDAPHFMLTVSVDMAEAMQKRAEINAGLHAAGLDVKLSVNDLIVKACALALQQFPAVNVSFQGDHIAQFDTSNIGVAVAVDEGLVTPVIRHAESKTLSQISRDTRELAQRARDRDLMPEDYQGGTFTVSNLGMFGIEHFTAVINPPQAAILACGAVQQQPVVVDGELTVGTRMKVTLSCDHRAIDGATGAQFLQVLVRLLENPLLLLV